MKKIKHSNVLIVITNTSFIANQLAWSQALSSHNVNIHTLSFVEKKLLKDITTQKGYPCLGEIIYRKPFCNHISFPQTFDPLNKQLAKLLYLPFSICVNLIRAKIFINSLSSLLKKYSIDALFLPESSPAYLAPEIVTAARACKIATFTSPIDRDSPRSYAMIYKSSSDYAISGIKLIFVKLFFFNWIYYYNDQYLIRLPIQYIILQSLLGIASPYPWHTIGFLENYIIVQSRAQGNWYQNLGVCSNKILYIGSPIFDKINLLKVSYSHIKRLKRSYCIDPKKKIIIISLPQTHWINGRPEAEYQNHHEMIMAFLSPFLSTSAYNVLISLHPSMDILKYKYLEAYSFYIIKHSLYEVIFLADLFISLNSSVVPWAIAQGIPCIVYDVYRYYLELPELSIRSRGTLIVQDQQSYLREVNSALTNDSLLQDLCSHQLAESKTWGFTDGLSISRLLEFEF